MSRKLHHRDRLVKLVKVCGLTSSRFGLYKNLRFPSSLHVHQEWLQPSFWLFKHHVTVKIPKDALVDAKSFLESQAHIRRRHEVCR